MIAESSGEGGGSLPRASSPPLRTSVAPVVRARRRSDPRHFVWATATRRRRGTCPAVPAH